MTELHIVTAGRTGPNRAVRFGGDASLDERGRRDVEALAVSLGALSDLVSGPESAVRESAGLLGRRPHSVDDALRTLDVGEWSGRLPEEIDPGDLGTWFGDPTSRPHGGETVAEFVTRIHQWRARFDDTTPTGSVSVEQSPFGVVRTRLTVVAMPVAQALLVDDPADFFRTQVRPATRYVVGGC